MQAISPVLPLPHTLRYHILNNRSSQNFQKAHWLFSFPLQTKTHTPKELCYFSPRKYEVGLCAGNQNDPVLPNALSYFLFPTHREKG